MIDIDKLDEILENPDLENDFQEVFDFVRDITGQKINIAGLTPEDVEAWNEKFGVVLNRIIEESSGE